MKEPYVLFLPRWYPNRADPQLGVFTRKHASAVAAKMKVVVLYVVGDQHPEAKGLQLHETGQLTEYQYYYPVYQGFAAPFVNVSRYLAAFFSVWKQVTASHGIPSLLHAHVLLRPLALAYLISWFHGVPWVITEHWTGFSRGAFTCKSLLYKTLARFLYARANALTVVSEALWHAMEQQGIRNSKTLLIPNVVDVPLLVPANQAELIVLSVADLNDRNKNLSGAIRVMARLQPLHPGLHYHIIGGGEDESMLHRIAAEVDPGQAWLHFHGRQDNDYVLAFMQKASFVLTYSNIETFSVVTAEALALGKPVVATRCGGPEYFVHEGNGLLVEPGQDDQLQQALETMITDFSLYVPEKLSGEIKRKFGPETIGESFMQLYRSLLNIKTRDV